MGKRDAPERTRVIAALFLSLPLALPAQGSPDPSSQTGRGRNSTGETLPSPTAAAAPAGRHGGAGDSRPTAEGASSGSGPRGTPSPGTPPQATQDRLPSPYLLARSSTRSSFVTVGGRLAPLRRIDHSAGVAGVVSQVFSRPGSPVQAGTPILSITRESPGESYQPVLVRSRISGRVADIKPALGSEVGPSTVVASVIDDSSLTLEALMSDRDAQRVRALDIQSVRGVSAEGREFRGSLSALSLEPDYATGLFTARFLFPAQAGASVGTVLFIDLPVSEVRGVFVDRALIQRRFGRSFLWAMGTDDRLALMEVRTGALFDREIAILGGIEEGTRILRRLTGKEREGMERSDWEDAAAALPPASAGTGGSGGQLFGGGPGAQGGSGR